MSRSQPHSRQPSTDNASTSSNTGASYQLILDHILTYPASYEIPLRTMYSLNSSPGGQPLATRQSSASISSAGSSNVSPVTSQSPWNDKQNTQAFAETLMTHISSLSHQPSSLPPSFIISFVRKCFANDLVEVDFPQALTGLDYLKDLEVRRRREVASAMARLAIDRPSLTDTASSLSHSPGVLQWLREMEAKERKIDIYYSQLYISLRRWIMINELSLLPFNKGNCIAMLNTLYPFRVKSQPTSKITVEVLQTQRKGFFEYIHTVERKGPHVLSNLMRQGVTSKDEGGWTPVTRSLNLYLQLANSMIFQCADIVDVDDLSSPSPTDSKPGPTRSVRKADSGISFGSNATDGRRPSQASLIPPKQSATPAEPSRPKTPSGGARAGTALEKLARGLRTIGRSRVDATEIIAEPTVSDRPRGLRKMRSLGALDRSAKKTEMPSYDAQQMRRERMKFEASVLAEQKFGVKPKAHEC